MSPRALGGLRLGVAGGLPLAVLVIAGLLAAARWPAYWAWVAPEQAPMQFFQVAVLLGGVFTAALLALVAALRGARRGDVAIWLVVAAGFVALALDDRFYVHQRLRDAYLAPTGVGLPWGSPGDVVLVGYALAGLAFLPLVLRLLSADRLARSLLVAGVALTAAVVAADSRDVESMSTAFERLEQTLEEVAEGVAGALLAAGLMVHLAQHLVELADREGAQRRRDGPAATSEALNTRPPE